MSRKSEVIIVGGGVIGTATAYYLSKAGVDVTLVDRGDIAGATSSACDGNVLVIDKKPGFDSRMGTISQSMYATLQDELSYDLEYRRKGSVLAVENEEQALVARDVCAKLKDAGLPMRYIEASEVHEDEPNLAPDIIGLVECASDSSVNPMAVAFGFASAARRHGAKIKPFCEVRSIVRSADGRVTGVETSEGTLSCDTVVLSLGAWTPFLAEKVGVRVPITPRKGHILVAERTVPVGRRKVQEFGYLMAKFGGTSKRAVEPDMETHGVAFVFEPTPHGNFLIGSSRQFAGYDTACDPRVLRLLARRAVRFYPMIRSVNIIRSYAGVRPYTPDHLPIVGPVDEVPGLYIAAGHEGDGIGLAPISGLLISEMITGKPTTIPIEPLSLSRFHDKL